MYEHKKGATLSLAGVISAPVGGTLPDFSDWTASSQIRLLDGTLVATLNVTWLAVATGRLRIYSNNTSNWPVGMAQIDVKFALNSTGETVYSNTQPIQIVQGITTSVNP